MTVEQWLGLGQTFGVALIVLAFVGWCLIGVARWAAPLVERHIERIGKAVDAVSDVRGTVDDHGRRITRVEGHVGIDADTPPRPPLKP